MISFTDTTLGYPSAGGDFALDQGMEEGAGRTLTPLLKNSTLFCPWQPRCMRLARRLVGLSAVKFYFASRGRLSAVTLGFH